MKNILDRYVSRYGKKHRDFRRYAVVVAVLALVVFVGVNWRLHDKGISMTSDYQCGLKEHKHTGKCYKNVLICSKEETDGSEGHTHTDACYKEEKKLTCGKEEHKHNADCYDEDGNLICGKEEHAHSEQCYTTEKKLICGKKESKPVAAHHHTDACYKKELICGLKEHTHTAACYSDESADVEKTSDWEATIPELTGNWAEDIVSVAQSQLGYEESTANFKLADDGKTRKGYTRYGEWYGNKYGDWSAMFASFCLNYAGIPSKTVPVNSGCPAWITELKQDKLYKTAANYTPAAGDIVFLDTDSDGKADHAGIITETKIKENTADNKVTSLTAIVGDSSDKVEENTYKTADDVILGYCALPENPDEKKVDTAEGKEAESTVAGKAEAKSTETEKQAKNSESTTAKGDGSSASEGTAKKKKAGRKTAKSNEAAVQTAEGVAVQSGEGSNETYASFTPYVTSLEGEGTKYNKDTGNYTSDLTINFEISKAQITTTDQYTYEFKYPEGIKVPDSLVGEYNYALQDSNKTDAGTYCFVNNGDGTYSVRVTFDKEYIEKAGDNVRGFIQFEGELNGSKADDAGNIVIKGEDSVELNIPNKDITYPEDETNRYNIDVSKSGTVIEGGKLKYTVIVKSSKGTPADIDFKDVIKMTGMNLGAPEVTVKKQPVKWHSINNQQVDTNSEEYIEVSPSFDTKTGTLTMTLPQLTAQKNNSEYIDCFQYVVTYIYDIAGMNKVIADNTVDVISKNVDTNTTVKDKANKTVNDENKSAISKEAKIVENNQVEWKITINKNKRDISGSTLTDSMFDRIPSNAKINVSPNNGYDIEYNSDGKIKDILFKSVQDGKNAQIYTITYYTDYEKTDEEQTEENEAKFYPSDDKEIPAKAKVIIPAYFMEKKVSGHKEDLSKGTAEVNWTVYMEVQDTKIPKGTVIEDDMTQNKSGEKGRPQYMTVNQIKSWKGQMTWDNGSTINLFDKEKGQAKGIFYDEEGNSYSYEDIADGKVDKDTKFTKFKIELLKDVAKPDGVTKLNYSYSTTADLKDIEQGKNNYYNTVDNGIKKVDDTYTYENKQSILKTGEIVDGKIKWTIIVNDKWTDITDGVLSDPMFSQIAAGTKLDINPGYGYTINYNDDKTIKDIKFTKINGGVNNSRYTITYYTPYTSEWNEKTVSNEATFKPSVGQEIHGTGEVTIPGGSVTKSMDEASESSNGKAKVKWTVSLNIPGGKIPVGSEGVTITDNMNSGKSQYMTVKQVQEWGGDMLWNTTPERKFNILDGNQAKVKFYDTKGQEYLLEDILANKVDQSVQFTHFEIKLLKDLVGPEGATKATYTYYTIADLSNASAGSNIYRNTVRIEDKESSATYTYENKHTISKTAKILSKNQIEWTITVNENKANITNGILEDTKFTEIEDINKDIKIEPEEGYIFEYDSAGKIKDIKFTEVNGEDNKNTYVITYRTPYKTEWNEQDITNNVSFKPVNGKVITTTKTVQIPGCSFEKTSGDATEKSDKIEIPWTVRVGIPDGELPADNSSSEYTVITDDMMRNKSGSVVSKKQYMTAAQVINWGGKVRWDNSQDTFSILDEKMDNIVFYDIEDSEYTYAQIKENEKGLSEKQFVKFEIRLKKKITKPEGATKIIYTYKTTVNKADASIGVNNYCNSAWIGDRDIGATYVYNKGGIIKTDGAGKTGTSQTQSENELTWKMEVTTDDKDYSKITVSDKLPSGLKLKEISVTDSNGQKIESFNADEKGNISASNDAYKVDGTYKDDEIILNLSAVPEGDKVSANSKYTFTIVCRTKDDSAFKNNTTYTFENTASVSFDEKTIDSSKQTQEWTKKENVIKHDTVEKSAVWYDYNNQADYSILLNPDAKDLVEGTDILTLEDIFKCQKYPNSFQKADDEKKEFGNQDIFIRAELVPSKVKLYYAEKGSNGKYYKGNEVTGWKWEYDYTPTTWNEVNHKLTVSNIPDSTALIFEYTYAMGIDAPGKIKKADFGSLSNTAKLMGVSNAQDGNKITWNWEKVGTTSGISTEKTYTIYKVEEGNFGKTLPGAKFKLQKYDKTQEKYVDVTSDNKVKIFESDKDGKIIIKWNSELYQYNTLYHLVETQAPQNYNLTDKDSNVYFYFSDNTATNNLPDSIPKKTVNLTEKSMETYVENESNLTSISVKKNWKDMEGNAIGAASEEIKFNLYQQERDTDPASKVNVTVRYGQYWDGDNVVPLVCNKGDKIKFTLTDVYSKPNVNITMGGNSTALEATSVSERTLEGNKIYTYEYEYEVNQDVTISTTYRDWRNSPNSFTYKLEPKQYTSKKIGEYTISKDDHWQKTIEDLPLTKIDEESGETIYYTYYIEEQNESAYKGVEYSNNEGINSGTIIISNILESYTLPETGGSGTLPFIAIGASLMGFALLCGYSMRRRRGRRVE